MAAGLEPAFTPGRPVWPLAGRALADLKPDDPDLAIPHGALQKGVREAPERLFHARHDGLITHKPTEPLAPTPPKTRDLQRKWKLALIASCFFHAALALFFIQAADDAAKIEGAEYSGEAMLGNASEEQVSAGETANIDGAVEVTMITMLEAKPVETIEAETVPVEESAQAVEAMEPTTADVETLEPVEQTRSQPADVSRAERADAAPAEQAKAEAVEPAQAQPVQPDTQAEAAAAEEAPEVLATERSAVENGAVRRPSEATEAEAVAKPSTATVKTVQPEKTETKPLEPEATEKTVRAEPEPKTAAKAEEKPAGKTEPREKPVEKKASPKKQDAKPKAEGKKAAGKAPSKRASAGNGGKNKADTRRGQANGSAGSEASSRGGKASAAGNAAVSNYPGKVAAKLRRALRYPAAAKRKRLRGTVQVAFVVSASGGVGSVRVVSSSGSPILDKAALETVRRAAPFPKIPAGAGRSSWPFSVPLAFSR